MSLSSSPQRPGKKPGLVFSDPEAPVLVEMGVRAGWSAAWPKPASSMGSETSCIRAPRGEPWRLVRVLFWPLCVCPCSSTHLSVANTCAETHMHLYTCTQTQENKLHQCQSHRTVSLNVVFGKAQQEMGWGLPGLPTLTPASSTVTLRASFLD